MTSPINTLPVGERLVAIDALRGIAAILVVFYHLYGHLKEEMEAFTPVVIQFVFAYGYIGVPIFFVLSGFVISMSTFNKVLSLRFAARFFLRRSLRLDPVYWAAIVLSLGLLALKNTFLGGNESFPTMGEILLHAVYLQDIFHLSNQISPVFWTLCLEIQFYLFFVGCLCFLAWLVQARYVNTVITLFLFITFALSMWTYFFNTPFDVDGLFFNYWHFFASGVILVRALRFGGMDNFLFFFALSSYLAAAITNDKNEYIYAALATLAIIYFWGKTNRLTTALAGRSIQFLGKTSYSLYLTHPEVGWKFISVGLLIPGIKTNSIGLSVLFILAVLVSIVFAYLFYLAVERPALNLAKKIKA